MASESVSGRPTRFTAGARLGPYELLQHLGTGGMGEVYEARDTRLDRTVAIKVLPANLATDPDRRARFEREARAVAALNHSHICALHDVGEAPASTDRGAISIRFLVMERLEGQTLAERLLRGALPIAQVLRFGIELADALDHAHRRGLIHRDIKPANVMLTEGGTKLLDFGLSKEQAPSLIALSTVSHGEEPLSAAGALLGTYPYMAPEQLTGREADARSDIFALGATIFEMATGRRAFQGETAAAVIGAVMHANPPSISSLQPLAPDALDRLVSRCLAKDPDDRWQTSRDLLLELKWLAEGAASQPPDRRRQPRKRALIAAGVLALAAAIGVSLTFFPRNPADDVVVRFTFSEPKQLTRAEPRFGGPITIAPDGRRVVYVATGDDGKRVLWIHSLDSAVPRALAGTDGAAYPFWSPDSRSVGFFADERLKRIDAAGGPVQTLTNAVLPRGGTWSRTGGIVFSAGAGRELYRVAAGGGAAVPVPPDQVNEERQWPSFLPDGRHIVYFGRRQTPGLYVSSLESHDTTLLAGGLYMGAAYVRPGYLVFFSGGSMMGTLFARPFDAERRQFTGEPVPLAESVPFYPLFARADFSVSDNGTLLFGTRGGAPTELVWFDRLGKLLGSVPGGTGYARPALSPDDKTIAADRLDPETQSQDVWLIEVERGVTSRLTTNPGHDQMGRWSPDGRSILYGSIREWEQNGTRVRTLSGERDERIFKKEDSAIRQWTDWSPDGKLFVYGRLDPKTKWDLWVVPTTPDATGAQTPIPYLQTEFNEHHGRLSPDGRWMAYTSDESGRPEVYVDAFPARGARSQVSTSGGYEPQWRRDGKELFYQSMDRLLMVAAVETGATLTASRPRALFKMPTADAGTSMPSQETNYVPTRDGQRFLVNAIRTESTPVPPVTVVLGWTTWLDRH